MKDLGWLAIGVVLVQVAASCDKNCDPEVEHTPAGDVKVITCTVDETCDGVTTRREIKFQSQGSRVWDAAECGKMRGHIRADCTYDVEIENRCIPRQTDKGDRQPDIIIGGAVVSTGYGISGQGGAGGWR